MAIDYENMIANAAKGPFAMSINGTAISSVITNFMVENVEGRDSLSDDIEEHMYTRVDGGLYRYRRHASKDLTVTYAIVSNTDATQRAAMNRLRALLMGNGTENAKFIFADEPDKYWVGTVSGISEQKIVYNNTSTGAITIRLTAPFKYAVNETTVNTQVASGTTLFVVDYDGTYKAYPTFTATFATENVPAGGTPSNAGDCGYVAFVNQNGDVIQLGDPDETDLDSKSHSDTLINQKFTIWDTQAYQNWETNNATHLGDDFDKTGSVGKTTMFSTDLLTVASYGTGEKWHGPSIRYEIPSNDVTDYTVRFGAVFATGGNPSTAVNVSAEQGVLRVMVESADKVLSEVQFLKNDRASNKGSILLYVDGELKETLTDVDFGTFNKRYGWKKEETDPEPNRNVQIRKKGNTVTFKVKGTTKEYTVDSETFGNAKYLTVYMGRYKEAYGLGSIGLTEIKLTNDHWATGEQMRNTFSSNDVCVVDCANADILLNGQSSPGLGAVGNQWESFALEPGLNQIGVNWSSWVTNANKPTFTMTYRKAYL